MSDKKNLAVEIKDLVVEFRTDDAIWRSKKAKPWAW